jgi:hypothetical protein
MSYQTKDTNDKFDVVVPLGFLIVLIACLLTGVFASSTNHGATGYAYVTPVGVCGYAVAVHYSDASGYIELSKCLPLPEATKLTDDVNKLVDNRWKRVPYSGQQ